MRPALETLKGKKDLVGVEIGVDSGLNALEMFQDLDIKKLYLIDPWKHYGGMTGHGALPDDNDIVDGCLAHAKKVLEDYDDKIVWLKDLSENVTDKVEGGLDFVYVDGNHRYEYIKKDIKLYFPKLKIGGMMSGHDHKSGEPGVVRAVREFFNGEYERDGWDWWCYKKFDKNNPTYTGTSLNDRLAVREINHPRNPLNRVSLQTLRNKEDLVGAEIGVSAGDNAFDMLVKLDIEKLYLIDPYKEFQHFQQHTLDKHKRAAHDLLSVFEHKIVWLEMKSEEAIHEIKDELDFVYIDGDHLYETAKLDIELYYPRVKKRGLISGDNFEVLYVQNAIKDYFEPLGRKGCYRKNNDTNTLDWWYVKDV